jgi:hypothetical protein
VKASSQYALQCQALRQGPQLLLLVLLVLLVLVVMLLLLLLHLHSRQQLQHVRWPDLYKLAVQQPYIAQ